MRYQLRWWREGGFRFPPLARLTNGRYGLGRWTQAELDAIRKHAKQRHRRLRYLGD